MGQPQQRERAVRATIEASTSLLSRGDAERFAELGVFAEDEASHSAWWPGCGRRRLAWMTCGPHRCAGGWRSWPWSRRRRGRAAGWPCMMWSAISCGPGSGRGGWPGCTACCWMRSRRACPPRPAGSRGRGARCGWLGGNWAGQDRYLRDHLIEHLQEAGRVGAGGGRCRVTCAGWGRGWSGSGLPPRLLT